MIIKHFSEVPEERVKLPHVERIKVRWLIDDTMGRHFVMRRYEVNGKIPIHTHIHEHEVYVLSGLGNILTPNESHQINSGDFIYIESKDPHGFERIGKDPLSFLCMVPTQRGKTELINEH
jgi:quercetin dioxygenase-like cupin family protein